MATFINTSRASSSLFRLPYFFFLVITRCFICTFHFGLCFCCLCCCFCEHSGPNLNLLAGTRHFATNHRSSFFTHVLLISLSRNQGHPPFVWFSHSSKGLPDSNLNPTLRSLQTFQRHSTCFVKELCTFLYFSHQISKNILICFSKLLYIRGFWVNVVRPNKHPRKIINCSSKEPCAITHFYGIVYHLQIDALQIHAICTNFVGQAYRIWVTHI